MEEKEILEEQKHECHCGENQECQHGCHNEEHKECKCENHKETRKEKKDKEHKLKEEIKRLEEENKALIEKVKFAQAEQINYRRRKDEETANMLKFANQDLISEIIPVVDNFERAIKLDDNDLTDELSKFLAGFKMMYGTLVDVLRKYGVEEINRAGQIFDPKEEQALLTDCVADKEDEEVLEVLLKGYKLKGRVIRPASVKVNQK